VQTTSQVLQIALEQIKTFESYYALSQWPGGWTAEMVGFDPGCLPALEAAGVIRLVRDDNGRLVDAPRDLATGYRMTSLGFYYHFPPDQDRAAAGAPIELPDDLFDSIVGYDEVKDLLRAALTAPRPVHVLLIGPPALAKSLFLWEIERACGAGALWLLGSGVSQSGMWDLVAEQLPQVLLLDELEKMRQVDQAALLSLMEGGRLVRAKVRRGLNVTLECRVFAAANSTRSLTPEVLSRFARRVLHPYSPVEFEEVVTSVLAQREGVAPEEARHIAASLAGRTQDVRDAIRVARLAHQVGVDRANQLLGLLDT
jgi:holliday junction DNA helicase RuvB